MGQQRLAFLSTFAASWTSQRFFKEWRMGQEQKQPPFKVVWDEQCPGTSLARYPPWTRGVVATTLTVLPNTFSLQQWRSEADFWHYWRSRNTLLKQRETSLPPATLLFHMPGSHSTKTEPHAQDVLSLSSLTPNHALFPLFPTLNNYRSSVTFVIKGTYSQEHLISQVIQPNSLDAKLNQVAQTDSTGMQDFWLVQFSFEKSGRYFCLTHYIQKLRPLCHFTPAAGKWFLISHFVLWIFHREHAVHERMRYTHFCPVKKSTSFKHSATYLLHAVYT